MNEFQDDKLTATDEGSLNVAVSVDNDKVVIDFGKQLDWIAFEKETLRGFIDLLESKYKQL